MGAVGEKPLEPRFGFRHRVRLGDADGVEAAQLYLLDQRGLDLTGIG
jgi:hypothetical protein